MAMPCDCLAVSESGMPWATAISNKALHLANAPSTPDGIKSSSVAEITWVVATILPILYPEQVNIDSVAAVPVKPSNFFQIFAVVVLLAISRRLISGGGFLEVQSTHQLAKSP